MNKILHASECECQECLDKWEISRQEFEKMMKEAKDLVKKCKKNLEDYEKELNMSDIEIKLSEPIKVSIDKEYFELKFKEVFKKWEYDLGVGFDIYKEEKFFNELMDCFENG